MERLQIAIEKARANRSLAQGQAAAAADPGPQAAPQAPGQVPGQAAGRAEAADASPSWAALAEMVPDRQRLRRGRVMTLEPGRDALPFDLLRTKIVQQAVREGWRRIAVISPHAAAGKTTLVANLAFCFGRQGDIRTLVLDFDLRRPGLGALLGQSPKRSMADVILGRTAFADHALRHGGNLAFGLNRAPVRNAAEILQSRDAARLLAELDRDWQPDFLLFDMPPVLATDDALGFLRHVDAALIVAEAERTPIRQIETVEAQVSDLTRVMGVVLNRCRYMGRDAGDYGYY